VKQGIASPSACFERVPNVEAERVTDRDDQETERAGLRESRTREPDDLAPPVRGTASQSGRAVNGTGCVWLCSGTTRPLRNRMSDDELRAGCERATS